MKKYIILGLSALLLSLTVTAASYANVSLREMIVDKTSDKVAAVILGELEGEEAVMEEGVMDMPDFVAGSIGVGPEILSDITVRGIITESPTVQSTTTAGTAATLVASDLTNSGLTLVTLGGSITSGGNFTYTLPASSTVTNLVPRVGARSKQCWMLVATTTSSRIVLAAGTGFDFRHASTSAADDGVHAFSNAVMREICLEFMRQPTDFSATSLGDITTVVKVYEESD